MPTLVLTPRKDSKPCSEALQNALDKVGYGLKYDAISFGQGTYPVDEPLEMNSGTAVTCTGEAVIKLIDQAPTSIWKSMTPILGQAQKTIENITIEKISFDGNDLKQTVKAGKGFHNFIFLQNAKNIDVHGIKVFNSKGDGVRIKEGTKIRYHDNIITHCGHDGLYVDSGSDVQAWSNTTWLRTNSAIRYRAVTDGLIQNNKIYNKLGSISSGPGIQLENPAKKASLGITVQNNTLENVNGPGIWAIGVGNKSAYAAKDLVIKGNKFTQCGMEPAGIKTSGVGGCVIDGWDDVTVAGNEFESCRGHAVLFGKWQAVSSGTGYSAEVRNNTIKNTKKAYYVGLKSGTAVANLLGAKYSVLCSGNMLSGNIGDYYGVREM